MIHPCCSAAPCRWSLILVAGCMWVGTISAGPAEVPPDIGPDRQVVQMELTGQNDTEPKLGYGNCQWLNPLEASPEALTDEPDYQSENPVYYAAELGDPEDNTFVFVIDESGGTGTGYDLVYVDCNNDNRIDSENERFKFLLGSSARTEPLRISLMVTAKGKVAPYFLNFSAFPYSDEKYLLEKIHANLRNSSYYQGEAELLGKRRTIAIADLDTNGLFNDVEQKLFKGDRFFVDLEAQAVLPGRSKRMESFPYGGYTRIEGVWHRIEVSPDGSRVEIVRERPALGKVQVPQRISAARLVSPTQALDLQFRNGLDAAVAGTYRAKSVDLLAEGEGSGGRSLRGTFGGQEPELTVTEGQSTQLAVGLPLKVEAIIIVDEQRTMRINLAISGVGGEMYRWSPRRGTSSKAGYEIFGPNDELVVRGEFEYG
jgi:hypothetical protein